MKTKIALLILLSTMLVSFSGCILPPPGPDREERHGHDRDRHDRDRDRHDRDGRYDHDRGGEYDHDRGRY